MELKEAVLLLAFNRPNVTIKVFEAIRKAKPPRLYVAVDGPRPDREGEAERVAEVREVITSVDWSCQVKTLIRGRNLGCKIAVSEAITWFFEQEDQGIILEDDCLPSESFFTFCQDKLNRHRDDHEVWMVCGFNPKHPGENSSHAFLSQNPSVWGWACWRDRWMRYDIDLSFWTKDTLIGLNLSAPKYVHRYYRNSFNDTKSGRIDTWDYQLTCLILVNNGFVIKPYANLISNIGVSGTHAVTRDQNHFVPLGTYTSKGDVTVCLDLSEDLWFYKTRLKPSMWTLPARALRKIKRLIA